MQKNTYVSSQTNINLIIPLNTQKEFDQIYSSPTISFIDKIENFDTGLENEIIEDYNNNDSIQQKNSESSYENQLFNNQYLFQDCVRQINNKKANCFRQKLILQQQIQKIENDQINQQRTKDFSDEISSESSPGLNMLQFSPVKSPTLNNIKQKIQNTENFEDHYEISNKKPLGDGTSGCVYQCIKKSDKKVYAVKVIPNIDEEMIKSIKQTFSIQYRLDHTYISKAYEVYINEDTQIAHYVMEYLNLINLQKLLNRKKHFSEKQTRTIIKKLLESIIYMERKGVCHRDLKPDNIMVSENLQEFKIIDFGIAKIFTVQQRLTNCNYYKTIKMYSPTGTPSYKAPEMIIGGGYTHQIDMWTVGVIAYQLYSGELPFQDIQQQWKQLQKQLNTFSFKLNFENDIWKNCSDIFIDFIKHLLRYKNRLTAFEAISHLWIQQQNSYQFIGKTLDDNINKQIDLSIDKQVVSVPNIDINTSQRIQNHKNITSFKSIKDFIHITQRENISQTLQRMEILANLANEEIQNKDGNQQAENRKKNLTAESQKQDNNNNNNQKKIRRRSSLNENFLQTMEQSNIFYEKLVNCVKYTKKETKDQFKINLMQEIGELDQKYENQFNDSPKKYYNSIKKTSIEDFH